MNNYLLKELKEMIIKKWGDDEIGCFINGVWFSPVDVLKIIDKLDKEY